MGGKRLVGTADERVGVSEGFQKWVALDWDMEGDGWDKEGGIL